MKLSSLGTAQLLVAVLDVGRVLQNATKPKMFCLASKLARPVLFLFHKVFWFYFGLSNWTVFLGKTKIKLAWEHLGLSLSISDLIKTDYWKTRILQAAICSVGRNRKWQLKHFLVSNIAVLFVHKHKVYFPLFLPTTVEIVQHWVDIEAVMQQQSSETFWLTAIRDSSITNHDEDIWVTLESRYASIEQSWILGCLSSDSFFEQVRILTFLYQKTPILEKYILIYRNYSRCWSMGSSSLIKKYDIV